MNEAILAYIAWQSINHDIWCMLYDYMDKHTDGDWGDNYLHELADHICYEIDKLEQVLEWLEKKFE